MFDAGASFVAVAAAATIAAAVVFVAACCGCVTSGPLGGLAWLSR